MTQFGFNSDELLEAMAELARRLRVEGVATTVTTPRTSTP